MEESWKLIDKYQCYEVSNHGQVRRITGWNEVKLSSEEIQTMKELYRQRMTFQQIGIIYGVCRSVAAKYILGDPSRVRSHNRIRKLFFNRTGYPIVSLSVRGRVKTVPVHRLVAEAFIGKIEKPLEVNHKNGVRSDNRLENLELVTRTENALHSINVLQTPHKGRFTPGDPRCGRPRKS